MLSIIESIKRWFSSFFGTQKITTAEVLPEFTPEIAVSKKPGLSCPVCNHRIIVSIENLLSDQSLLCPSCGLELTVDQEKSQTALEALDRLQSGLNQASKMKSENGI